MRASKLRYWVLASLATAAFGFLACDDENKVKVPAECSEYPNCEVSTACTSPEAKLACSCSDAEKCRTDATCNGKGSCSIDCSARPLCQQYEACKETKACYGEIDPGKCDPSDLAADSDFDGLSNGVEQLLGTDPCNPDSDGDTIPDGVEDANQNGLIETLFGESNPTNASDPTDAGAVAGVRNAVCTYEKMLKSEVGESLDIDFGNVRVAKLKDFDYQVIDSNLGIAFSNANKGIYGFVYQDREKLGGRTIMNVGQDDILVAEESNFTAEVPLNSWLLNKVYDHDNLQIIPDHTVNRLKYAVTLPQDSSVAGHRNLVLAKLIPSAESIINALPATDICAGTTIKVSLARSLHENYSIVSYVATCSKGPKLPEDVQSIMDDVLTGTLVSTTDYRPFKNFVCQISNIGEATGMVDFYWIVDNSGSMLDELKNLSSTVDRFAMQLRRSNINYRIAVSTTDAYSISEFPTFYDKNKSYFLNLSKELEIRQYLRYGLANPLDVGMFRAAVTADSACNGTIDFKGKAEYMANLCGLGYEDGLESARLMLKRLKQNIDDPQVENDAFKLREGAINYIIWVSDEESRQFKEENGVNLAVCKTGYKIDYNEDTNLYSKAEGTCREDKSVQPHATCSAESGLQCADAIGPYTFDETATLEEIEKSNIDYAHVLKYYMQELQPYNVVAFALVGDKGKANDGLCPMLGTNAGDTIGANYGLSYILLAKYLSSLREGGGKEGGYASICSTNYETTVSDIISDAVGRVASHPLKGYPISSTIRVAVEEKLSTGGTRVRELPRSSSTGWQYDPSQNAIILYGLASNVTKDSKLAIAYVIWQRDAG